MQEAPYSYLEGAADAALAEPSDAVQIVGGDGLILLLDEAERWEVEAGLLAIPVLQHGGQLIYRAPFNKRRTSQVPRLHMTWIHTGSVLMKERKGDKIKTRAPFGFTGSWYTHYMEERKPADMWKSFKFKAGLLHKRLNSLSSLERLEEIQKLQKVDRSIVWVWVCFLLLDLRDKQIKGGGVGGLWRHWGVAPIQVNKVPVEKEWGPQHRVRDSRSQVESSNLQSIKIYVVGN